MDNITILIFTPKNDNNLKECINSARILTNNIINIYPNSTFVETVREIGIRKAKTDWVLIIDVDERITKELAFEINEVIINKNEKFTYFKIPRKNIFAQKKWLKHGGWWPDYQTRLINKNYFIDWPKRIHSIPHIQGNCSYLKNPITHYFHGDLENMVNKTIIFEDIESELLFRANKSSSTLIFFKKFLAELWRRMFKNLGFLDGTIGVIESIYQAFSKTITYLFLYEKNNKSRTI